MFTKKRLLLLLKVAVSVGLIWLVLYGIDVDDAVDKISRVDPAMVVLAVFGLLVQFPIMAMRWRAVLGGIEEALPFPKILELHLIGGFFNQTLPSSVGGDAVRVILAHRAGLGLRGAVNGVMLERAATVLAIILLVAVTQPFFLTRVGAEARLWILPGLSIVALAAIGGLLTLMVLDRLPSTLLRWRVVRGLTYLASDTRRVFLVPRPAALSLGWGVVGHVNIALIVLLLAKGLDLEVGLLDCLALVPPVLLITTLPISIAGWGVREGAMVAAFALIGVPKEGAVVLSVLFGLVILLSCLPGGLVFLFSGARVRPDEAAPSLSALGEPEPPARDG